ncbi:MAG: glutamine synthetase [Alkaliphilus sp.]
MQKKMDKMLKEQMLFFLPACTHTNETLADLLESYKSIKFVSFVGVDLGGNSTDEKIPISLFIKDMDTFLSSGVQTDGSSVVLPQIATLNDAKVDIIPDRNVTWYVDYNYENLDEKTGCPIGTLRIPSFLKYKSEFVGSRGVLNRTMQYFTKEIISLFEKNSCLLEEFEIKNSEIIEEVLMTTATELEFWVKTPEDLADEEKLTTSQMLKEQYWKKTKGFVRTALEEVMIFLEKYGFEPEMGHKEVGGVTAKIGISGKQNHVMEQLEIDWKYNTALLSADNDLFIREFVEEIFEKHGLEVTFRAKPIEGVAGSGKHTHMGMAVRLSSGRLINIITAKNVKKDFMSTIGWGSLMGLLKNYEVINPFISATNDAFNRLKPGFEAPVCIVASVGHNVEIPSRNRTVLVGLVRDIENPFATRFELRSPNPESNTYLYVASSYLAMLDGIRYAANNKLTTEELEKEFSKRAGEQTNYLEESRMYRSEEDVFDDYTQEERNILFANPPVTVWGNLKESKNNPAKEKILLSGNVFSEKIIESYRKAMLEQWITELVGRIIPINIDVVRRCKKIQQNSAETDIDMTNWEKVNSLRNYLMKDTFETKSLFTRTKEALKEENYDLASTLQIEMSSKITKLKLAYVNYRKNLFEIVNGI